MPARAHIHAHTSTHLLAYTHVDTDSNTDVEKHIRGFTVPRSIKTWLNGTQMDERRLKL